MTNFAEIVDAADNLSVDEQESLIGIMQRRIAERNRIRLLREVADARVEHASGKSCPGAVADLMGEIRHEA